MSVSKNKRGGRETTHSSEKPHWSHSVAAHPEHCVTADISCEQIHKTNIRRQRTVQGVSFLRKQFCNGNGEKKLHLFSRN